MNHEAIDVARPVRRAPPAFAAAAAALTAVPALDAPHPPPRRIWPRGVVDLRLFFTVDRVVRALAPRRLEVVLDLSRATLVTDSGCAALLCIDRLAARLGVRVDIVNAAPEVVERMRPLCPATVWNAPSSVAPGGGD